MTPPAQPEAPKPYSADELKSLADTWADRMDISALFEVQIGLKSELPDWLPQPADDARACTVGSPDNKNFIIVVFDDAPQDRIEHILVHELVHVYAFSQLVGNDEREVMEVTTELCAQLVERCVALEARIANYEKPVPCSIEEATFIGDLALRQLSYNDSMQAVLDRRRTEGDI